MATPENMFTPPQTGLGKAKKNLAIQQAVGAIQPQQAAGPQAAQQLGAGAAQMAGQAALAQQTAQGAMAQTQATTALQSSVQQKQAQQAQQALGQQATQQRAATQQKTELSREQRDAEQQLTSREIEQSDRLTQFGIETDNNLSFLNRQQREELAALGSDVKQQLFDSRLQFARDEAGRKFTNERQLADYAVSSAQNHQELTNKLQSMKQVADRELKLMEVAHGRMTEALKQGSLDRQREMTQRQKEELARMKQAAEAAIRKKKAKANNLGAIISGAATIGGAIIGNMVAPGAGGVVGAQIGGAVGQVAASQT